MPNKTEGKLEKLSEVWQFIQTPFPMFPGGTSVKVKDLMSAPVITVKADTPLKEIIHLLSAHDISGVPVVDADEKVMGMISWPELFPQVKTITRPEIRVPVLFREIVDLKYTLDSYKASAHLTARDIMSPFPVVVDVEDLIVEVVWTLVLDNLYMVPVLEGDRLVGILTRRDFIRFLAQEL
jgi:CBS domain-containing protein